MRFGFFKLIQPKEQAADWVWIVDHIAPVGATKCLIIYGVRISSIKEKLRKQEEDAKRMEEAKAEALKTKKLKILKITETEKEETEQKVEKVHLIPQDGKGIYLSAADLVPLAIVPMVISNKELVLKELENCINITGTPCAILEDQGPDLKSGTEAFCTKHAGVRLIPDIKHKASLILSKHLDGTSDWEKFCRQSSELKSQVQQTKLSYLAPISQRKISRYMNLEIIDWGVDTLWLLDNGLPNEFKEDQKLFEEKFGWIRTFRCRISEWKEVLEVANVSVEFIRKYGHYKESSSHLEQILARISGSSQSLAHEVACDLLSFTEAQCETIKTDEFFPGDTEIIESMIGKYKYIVGEHSRWGITGAVLSMAAIVGEITPQLVAEALESTRVKQMYCWCKEKLTSMLGKRRAAFNSVEEVSATHASEAESTASVSLPVSVIESVTETLNIELCQKAEGF